MENVIPLPGKVSRCEVGCEAPGGKSLKYTLKTNMAALNLRYPVGLIINNLAQFSTLLTKLRCSYLVEIESSKSLVTCIWRTCKEKKQDKKEGTT